MNPGTLVFNEALQRTYITLDGDNELTQVFEIDPVKMTCELVVHVSQYLMKKTHGYIT